jgi:signal transduction histidine kinase
MVGAIFIPVTYFHFCLRFLGLENKKQLLLKIGYLLSFIFLLADTTPLFVKDVSPKLVFPFWPNPGILFHPFLVIFFVYVVYSVLLLIKAFKKAEGILRQQIKYILTGTILSFLGGSTNYFLWYDIPILPIGNAIAVIFVILLVYAIFKHHLFNIKVIATEIFSILLLIILLINVFSVRGLSEFIFNLVIFLAATIFAILLIRSVLQEVKIREDLEVLTSKLEAAYQELKQLDQAKTEFMSMASHQLRTPLTAIKGYISLALENQYGEIPANLRKALNNVYASNERMIRLVNDLLTISRIELGKMVLDKKPTQIEELIQSVIEELKINAEKKGLKLFFETPEKPLPQLLIDSLKIRQVLMNLIDNAIRYTHQGFIKIRAEKKDSFVRISVQDTGEGLSEKEKTTIFSGFTRGKAGIAFFIEGAGLGLMIAKKFVELHQGKIWADSEGRGKGSVFIFELPLKSWSLN